jgi:stress response protein YsnF
MVGNFENVRIWKEHVVRSEKVLGWKSVAETEESNEKLNKLSH